jgi:hypothetical protein
MGLGELAVRPGTQVARKHDVQIPLAELESATWRLSRLTITTEESEFSFTQCRESKRLFDYLLTLYWEEDGSHTGKRRVRFYPTKKYATMSIG